MIEEWYNSLEGKLRGHINTRLDVFQTKNKIQLINDKHIESSKKKGSELYEIKIRYLTNQYRIIFYFQEEENALVMLHAFLKKDRNDNRKGFSIGENRMKEILENGSRKKEYYFRKTQSPSSST